MKTKEYLIKNFIPIAKEEAEGLTDVIECLESIEHYLSIPVDEPVSPNFGGKIAEIRNLFSPILNMFTVAKEQRKYYLKVDKESRKQAVYLNKIEIAEKSKIMKENITEKIKTLLDELG